MRVRVRAESAATHRDSGVALELQPARPPGPAIGAAGVSGSADPMRPGPGRRHAAAAARALPAALLAQRTARHEDSGESCSHQPPSGATVFINTDVQCALPFVTLPNDTRRPRPQAIDVSTARATNDEDRQRILTYIALSYKTLLEFNETLKLLFLLVSRLDRPIVTGSRRLVWQIQ